MNCNGDCFPLEWFVGSAWTFKQKKTLIPSNDACERIIISFGKPRITKSFSKRQYFGNNSRCYLNITYSKLHPQRIPWILSCLQEGGVYWNLIFVFLSFEPVIPWSASQSPNKFVEVVDKKWWACWWRQALEITQPLIMRVLYKEVWHTTSSVE